MDATTIPANTVSFRDYLFKDKRNRTILILAAVAMVIQWAVFKWFYPFASYIHGDSFAYIKAASTNADISTHMIGYARFLRLFSVFSKSDTVLVTFQYLLAQTTGLSLLFTLFYFHNIHKTTRIFLLAFIIINPLFLYLGNLVSSDCLFMSLSLIWITLLLWLMHRPSNKIINWHTVILSIAFTVRYNALVYPAIGALAFWLSSLPLKKKLIGILSPFVLCGLFVVFTGNQYKKHTGIWQYAPFGGWQMANNAMYTYRYVENADRKPVPEKFSALDKMITTYYDTTRNLYRFPLEGLKASTYYMWTHSMPLYQYRDMIYAKDSSIGEFKKWALIAPFFKEYGLYIISKYPEQYIEHFIWPNTKKYFAPPLEFLEFYNGKKDSVNILAKNWFQYNSSKISSRLKDTKAYPLEIYPILTGIMNVFLVCCLICFLLLRKFSKKSPLSRSMIPVVAVYVLNAVFMILSTASAIRIQAFPILLETIFALVLFDWMCKLAVNERAVKPVYPEKEATQAMAATNLTA